MRVLQISGVVVGVALVGAVSLSAQNNGNPSILAAVQAVGSSLSSLTTTITSLVSTVNSINTTVNAINTTTAEGNVLFTPSLVAFAPDTVICTVTNVSSASHNLTVQLLNGNTAAVLQTQTTPLAAGTSTSVTSPAGAGGLRAFCKITVNDGGKSAVRGVMALFAGATASDREPVAAY